jgi:geranylgeranyl pyrophosphate synthase
MQIGGLMSDIDVKKMLLEKKPFIDKIIEKYVPKNYTEESLIFASGKPRYAYNTEAPNKALSEPIWDMMARGGKRWRPTLFLLIAEALGGDVDKIGDFVIIPEVVHNGTLMIDDIEDDSKIRRGQPCTHIKFGTDIAINAGNFMYYVPLLPLMRNGKDIPAETKVEVYNIYLQEMINLGFGQGMDIAWHKGIADADKVTEGEYLQMCAYKTGCLARMSAKISAVLANGTEEQVEAIGKLAETVGIAFQIQDDILNLVPSGVSKTKGCCGEDISEGKRTLMVIHTLKNGGEDGKRLIEILNMHTENQSLRDEAIGIMKKYDSLEYSKGFARKLVKEAWGDVDKLLPESEAKKKLEAFANFLIERDI